MGTKGESVEVGLMPTVRERFVGGRGKRRDVVRAETIHESSKAEDGA